jgi:hypothetical protein
VTIALRPLSTMTDRELVNQARELERLDDQAALDDPASLMRRVMFNYRHRPHLRIIAAAVSRVADPDPARRVDRVLIRVPPQTGKTVTAVVGGALWWLANRPTDRVIIGSYNSTLAVDRGRDVKKLVEDVGHRYGLRTARGSERVDDWRLTSGGGVKSVGIGSGVTGSPGDIAFIDDPHKSREEADSLRMRDRAYRWLSADVISRLSPGAPVIMVMTPWHPDDLSARVIADQGRIEDGGRWLVIDMPALCTHPDRDPLGRAYGAPLTHPKIPVRDVASALAHWEDKRSSSTVQDWSALYQLDAAPAEGALLTRDILRARRCWSDGSDSAPCNTEPVKAAVAVDPSGGGRDVAGIVGGYRGTDKRLYITHDWSGVMASDDWAEKACQLAVEIDADRIIVEVNFGGDMATLAIRTAWDKLRRDELEVHGGNPMDKRYRAEARYARLCPAVVAVRARKKKLLRADPVSQQWKVDRIRTAAYLPELEEEWATWQPDQTNSPGRIDASVYLAYALLTVPQASEGQAAPAPSGSMPVTTTTPLDRGGQPGGGGFTSGAFGPLG